MEGDELERIHSAINNGEVTFRDGAIVLLGLSTGICACDVIRLKLSDLDWKMETITFRQRKTGNVVHLPLTVKVGNAIARYIAQERPTAPND